MPVQHLAWYRAGRRDPGPRRAPRSQPTQHPEVGLPDKIQGGRLWTTCPLARVSGSVREAWRPAGGCPGRGVRVAF